MNAWLRGIIGTLAALLMVGCASVSQTRFYTLSAPSGASVAKDTERYSVEEGQGKHKPIFIEVMPVSVPERLARPQLVVRSQILGQNTQLFILEQDRWSSNFNYELRDAFATGIANRTGALNETRGIRSADQPAYRIAIELGQFDAIVGERVQARFNWTITRSTDGRGTACYSAISEPVDGGIQGVVKGIQRVVSSVAADVSRSLVELDTDHATMCTPRGNMIEGY